MRSSSRSYNWVARCPAHTREPASVSRSVAILPAQCRETSPSPAWSALDRHLRCRFPAHRPNPSVPQSALSGNNPSDVKVAELGVLRAHFVEPHVGHEFLEIKRISGEQRNAPFPGIESDGASNYLLYSSGVASAGQSVTVHQSASLVEGQRIPILVGVAPLGHWIKAHVRHVSREWRIKSPPDVIAVAFGCGAARESPRILRISHLATARGSSSREVGSDVVESRLRDTQKRIR